MGFLVVDGSRAFFGEVGVAINRFAQRYMDGGSGASSDAYANQAVRQEQETISCLSRAMAFRDGNTGNHVERVGSVAELLAAGLGLDHLASRRIGLAAPLHDVGKIGIPDSILKKPGKLTPDEMEQMRTHVRIGVEILRSNSSDLGKVATAIIAGHHEKWDGTGYPLGLKGESIPVEARIVAIADVFDALCSERPYKAAWSIERARQEILSCSGSHFDPACVAAFISKWPLIKALFEKTGNTPIDSVATSRADVIEAELAGPASSTAARDVVDANQDVAHAAE